MLLLKMANGLDNLVTSSPKKKKKKKTMQYNSQLHDLFKRVIARRRYMIIQQK